MAKQLDIMLLIGGKLAGVEVDARTPSSIRGLLVEHGALPPRDELAVRYDQWAAPVLERVSMVIEFLNWLNDHGLNELTKLGPVPIPADALGDHPSTIERHAIGSAAVYSQYIAARRQTV